MIDKFKITSWHENGDNIWFFVKGRKKSMSVPKEYVQSCQLTAVDRFKRQVKKMFND